MHSSIQYQMSQVHQSELRHAARRGEMAALARGAAPRRSLRSILRLGWIRPRAGAATSPLRPSGRPAF